MHNDYRLSLFRSSPLADLHNFITQTGRQPGEPQVYYTKYLTKISKPLCLGFIYWRHNIIIAKYMRRARNMGLSLARRVKWHAMTDDCLYSDMQLLIGCKLEKECKGIYIYNWGELQA